MDRYAVIGHPISHSLSPKIHMAFAEQLDQSLTYSAIEVLPEELKPFLQEHFASAENKGLNVTVPHKEVVFDWVDFATERACLAGASNTLFINDDGAVVADNTDGEGLVTDLLMNHHVPIKNKRILVLGAGGAVRGVLGPLLKEQPQQVVIANRTVSKAEALAERFTKMGDICSAEYKDLSISFDIIINGTSASLAGKVPDLPEGVIGEETVAYDMMYGKETTAFNAYCQSRGVGRAIDGLGMLLEQAASAFEIWRGLRPQTSQIMSMIR